MMEVDVKNLKFTDHALQRAKERFNKNGKDAQSYFRSVLEKAKYVGVIEDEHSHPCQLFAFNKIAIILSIDFKRVVTVYKADTVTYDPLKDKVLELHKKKFNHYSIKERALQKRLDQLKLESQVEIAQCKLRKYKTKSDAVKIACDARIKAIEQTIQEYILDIQNLQTEKRRVARSMISVM
jgi:hypothetical protein